MIALITGAAGFLGSHLIEHLLKTTDWQLIGLDRLDETSVLDRLDTDAYRSNRERFHFVWHDLKAPINPSIGALLRRPDVIFHLAASTHVDRSIENPVSFVFDNVLGTCHLLEWMRQQAPRSRFFMFSTDEVTGPAPVDVAFTEKTPLNSRNPYAATKAGAEELVRAFGNTYGLDVVTTRCMNAIGERQHVEKLVPKVVRSVLTKRMVPIHTDVDRRPGSRSYVHARNVAAALVFLVEHGARGEVYNLGGEREIDNFEMAGRIADVVGEPLLYYYEPSPSARPGHDLRYALDMSKLLSMGFSYPIDFDASLEKTVRWFCDPKNRSWLGL